MTSIAQYEQTLRHDVGGITSDVSGLGGDTTSTVHAADDVKTEAAHAGSGDPSTCGDADSVAGDADSVQGDADTVEGDLDTTTSALSQLRDQLQAVGGD